MAWCDGPMADDIVRVGPYGDRCAGKDDYLAFIAKLMPSLEGYVMDLHRVDLRERRAGIRRAQ